MNTMDKLLKLVDLEQRYDRALDNPNTAADLRVALMRYTTDFIATAPLRSLSQLIRDLKENVR